MKALKPTAGFILFTVVIEAMWMLLRVEILEDLNIFAEVRYWAWFMGAVVLFGLLSGAAAMIRRPAVSNGWSSVR